MEIVSLWSLFYDASSLMIKRPLAIHLLHWITKVLSQNRIRLGLKSSHMLDKFSETAYHYITTYVLGGFKYACKSNRLESPNFWYNIIFSIFIQYM